MPTEQIVVFSVKLKWFKIFDSDAQSLTLTEQLWI